jgi:hypothetical protein
VWWDSDIAPGKTWDELIERELASSSCVVVLWSATSLAKSWVKAEAAEALTRGALVPVLIEAVMPPLAFRQIQAAPLMDWRGDLDHPGFQQLLCSIGELVGLPTRPEVKDKEETPKAVRAKGGSARMQSSSDVHATVPAPAAKWAVSEPAGKPAASVVALPRREKPEMPSAPAAGSGGIGRRFAGTAAIALIAALTGYGIREGLDRLSEPSRVDALIDPLPETSAGLACAEQAQEPTSGTIAPSEGYEAVTRAELP